MLGKAEFAALDAVVLQAASMAMVGAATYRDEQGTVTGAMTNREVRKYWQLLSCEAESLIRRLNWWQKVTGVQLLAALFGTCRFECSDPGLRALDDDHALGPGANPWTKQFFSDMKHLVITESGAELLEITGDNLATIFEFGPCSRHLCSSRPHRTQKHVFARLQRSRGWGAFRPCCWQRAADLWIPWLLCSFRYQSKVTITCS